MWFAKKVEQPKEEAPIVSPEKKDEETKEENGGAVHKDSNAADGLPTEIVKDGQGDMAGELADMMYAVAMMLQQLSAWEDQVARREKALSDALMMVKEEKQGTTEDEKQQEEAPPVPAAVSNEFLTPAPSPAASVSEEEETEEIAEQPSKETAVTSDSSSTENTSTQQQAKSEDDSAKKQEDDSKDGEAKDNKSSDAVNLPSKMDTLTTGEDEMDVDEDGDAAMHDAAEGTAAEQSPERDQGAAAAVSADPGHPSAAPLAPAPAPATSTSTTSSSSELTQALLSCMESLQAQNDKLVARETNLAQREALMSRRECNMGQRETVVVKRESSLGLREEQVSQKLDFLKRREYELQKRAHSLQNREFKISRREKKMGQWECELSELESEVKQMEHSIREREDAVTEREEGSEGSDFKFVEAKPPVDMVDIATQTSEWTATVDAGEYNDDALVEAPPLSSSGQQQQGEQTASNDVMSQREAALGKREQDLSQREQATNERERQLNLREFKLQHEQQKFTLSKTRQEHSLESDKLQHERTLEQQKGEMEQQNKSIASIKKKLDESQDAMTKRESELDEREAAVRIREQAVVEHESSLAQRLLEQADATSKKAEEEEAATRSLDHETDKQQQTAEMPAEEAPIGKLLEAQIEKREQELQESISKREAALEEREVAIRGREQAASEQEAKLRELLVELKPAARDLDDKSTSQSAEAFAKLQIDVKAQLQKREQELEQAMAKREAALEEREASLKQREQAVLELETKMSQQVNDHLNAQPREAEMKATATAAEALLVKLQQDLETRQESVQKRESDVQKREDAVLDRELAVLKREQKAATADSDYSFVQAMLEREHQQRKTKLDDKQAALMTLEQTCSAVKESQEEREKDIQQRLNEISVRENKYEARLEEMQRREVLVNKFLETFQQPSTNAAAVQAATPVRAGSPPKRLHDGKHMRRRRSRSFDDSDPTSFSMNLGTPTATTKVVDLSDDTAVTVAMLDTSGGRSGSPVSRSGSPALWARKLKRQTSVTSRNNNASFDETTTTDACSHEQTALNGTAIKPQPVPAASTVPVPVSGASPRRRVYDAKTILQCAWIDSGATFEEVVDGTSSEFMMTTARLGHQLHFTIPTLGVSRIVVDLGMVTMLQGSCLQIGLDNEQRKLDCVDTKTIVPLGATSHQEDSSVARGETTLEVNNPSPDIRTVYFFIYNWYRGVSKASFSKLKVVVYYHESTSKEKTTESSAAAE